MAELPDHYQDDRFIVLARDPATLFAYWDLEADAKEQLALRIGQATLAESQWVLRLTHFSTAAISDTLIDPDARNWYLSVLPDSAYDAQLGVVDPRGKFHRVLTAGAVRTPPAQFSHLYDKQWMILEEDYLKLLSLGWAGFLGSSSGMSDEADAETAWVTVTPEPVQATDNPTSPGVPEYKGRK